MDLNQLRTFIAVADGGHVTRAAERLHLSQPAVSAQIKALEEGLAQRLFHRTSAGMELTQAGRGLLELAERVLAAAEELKRAARALKGEIAGKLRVGTLSDPQFIRLGEFLGQVLERYPLLELELQNEISGVALKHVREGSLGASFYFGEIPDASVAGLRLGDMTYCVAAPGQWAERVREADWREIAAMPWVLPPEISTITRHTRTLFREHGEELATHVEADDEDVIANLIESGVGLSLLREDIALEKQRAGEICVWDKARLCTPLWFIYLREREQDPLIRALLEVLRKTWGLESPPADEPAAVPAPAAAPARNSNRNLGPRRKPRSARARTQTA